MAAELKLVRTAAEEAIVARFPTVKTSLAGDAGVVRLREAAFDLFADDPKVRAEAKKLLQSQAAFLLGRMGSESALPAFVELAAAPGAPPAPPASLADEGLAIQAFLAAGRATADEKYNAAALRLARAVEARRFDPWAALYLGADPAAAGRDLPGRSTPRSAAPWQPVAVSKQAPVRRCVRPPVRRTRTQETP